MKHTLLYITLALLTSAATSMAATPDSALVEHHSAWNTLMNEAWKNPALHGQAYQTSYSQLRLGADYSRQTDAFVMQKGTGKTLYDVETETFLRLSSRAAVWGKASYMTGKSRNIKWSSVSDYELIEPYVLGDTLGGNTERERYVFEGGYATQLGRFLLGGELLFRADHEYRTVDPRMRSIVTDLTLRAGGAYETGGYHLGAALEANIYKQTNNVTFYRETGVIPEYQMTGLGTVYVRFSGEVNNLYFNGGGMQLYLNANPKDGNGFFGHITLSEHRYERIAASLNSLPLTKLYYEQAKAQVGWKKRATADWAFYANFDYTRRLGDENIAGSSLSNSYPILARLTMYKNDIINADVNATYGRHTGTADWHIGMKAGYMQNKEKYVEPQRQMEYSHVFGQLSGQVIVALTKQITLDGGLAASHFKNADSKMDIPVVSTDAAVMKMLSHNYQYLKADYTNFDAHLRGDYRFAGTRYGAFAELSGGVTACSENEQETRLTFTVGMTF